MSNIHDADALPATFVLQLAVVSPVVQIKSARIGSCAPECVDKAPAFCPNAELFASGA
jgi:hypothetical protein